MPRTSRPSDQRALCRIPRVHDHEQDVMNRSASRVVREMTLEEWLAEIPRRAVSVAINPWLLARRGPRTHSRLLESGLRRRTRTEEHSRWPTSHRSAICELVPTPDAFEQATFDHRVVACDESGASCLSSDARAGKTTPCVNGSACSLRDASDGCGDPQFGQTGTGAYEAGAGPLPWCRLESDTWWRFASSCCP